MNKFDPRHPLLSHRHFQLRNQLHAAYTAAVWDSQCIDRIAEQMLSVEQALTSVRRSSPPPYGDGAMRAAPENFVRLSSF